MPTPRTLTAAALSLIALACTSVDVNAPTTDDIMASASAASDANFDGKTTYAWGGLVSEIMNSDTGWKQPDPSVVADIQRVTEKELVSHGMTKVADSPAILAYYGAGADLAVMNLIDGADFQTSSIDPMAKVGMCIVLVDAATAKPLWAGIATGDIDWTPTETSMATRLEYAVDKMFKDFPG